ncbi:MAG: DUF2284 domain-containing protein [Thermodesulfobacteriota bacterium]|nr:DUF2284 domain-containing protein [Thermodesulfobacteriota bacterium]
MKSVRKGSLALSPKDDNDQRRIHLERLADLAISMGASDAKIIASSDILVKDELAKRCSQPRCQNYGLAPSCPPHVSGPAGFRDLQRKLEQALVVRVVVPSAMLLSSVSTELGRFVCELVASIEKEAIRMGFTRSRAFAGGSCKELFCQDHSECPKLSGTGECRYPKYARPSMSGYGIDVFALMKTCGWSTNPSKEEGVWKDESVAWVAGLVMIG